MRECGTCKRCFPDEISICTQDGDRTTATLPGEPTLDGRYELLRRIGSGSMGVVFEARHIFLKSSHAIKVFLPELVGNDPALITRFRQQALTAAAIRHQNIIAVTDLGVIRETMPFLVMEIVSGRSLRDVLAQEKAMAPERALEVVCAIGAGLEAAHRQNIVHHDLTPSNIMMQAGKGLKIRNFGLAKIKSEMLLGSPFYMAPEQWSNDEVDPRADIYSLGIILYEMLTGDVPFKGSSIASIMNQHRTLPPPSFESVRVGPAPSTEAVVRHALEKEVSARPSSVEAFIDELLEAVKADVLALGHRLPPEPIGYLGAPMGVGGGGSSAAWGSQDSRNIWETIAREREAARSASLEDAEREVAQRQEQVRQELERIQREDRANLASLGKSPPFNAVLSPPDDGEVAAARVPSAARTEPMDDDVPMESASPQVTPSVETPIYLDENVQFTVYKPRRIRPQKWYTLLAYAHLSERRAGENEPDPIERMEAEAQRILGEQKLEGYSRATEDSSQSVPRRGEITFIPFIAGVEFNPPSRSFLWQESVHGQEFRMLATAALDGKTVRGRMSVFLGSILLAEINLSLRVDSALALDDEQVPLEKEKPARPYRKVFPSYSHKDSEIVAQIEHYAQISGDEYMRDVYKLRSGQDWKQWMRQAIEDADIFQLFWSTNSMRSENVKLEWQHALGLRRQDFIRPTYWEDPLPRSQSDNLPPPELLDLHFQQVRAPIRMETEPARKTYGAGGAGSVGGWGGVVGGILGNPGNQTCHLFPPKKENRSNQYPAINLRQQGESGSDTPHHIIVRPKSTASKTGALQHCPKCGCDYTDASLTSCLEDAAKLFDMRLSSVDGRPLSDEPLAAYVFRKTHFPMRMPDEAPPAPKKRSLAWPVIIFALLVLIVGLLVIFLIVGN